MEKDKNIYYQHTCSGKKYAGQITKYPTRSLSVTFRQNTTQEKITLSVQEREMTTKEKAIITLPSAYVSFHHVLAAPSSVHQLMLATSHYIYLPLSLRLSAPQSKY